MDRDVYKKMLMDRLLGYFDFEEDKELGSLCVDFHAKMHRRNEKYVLQKKNVLYAYDNFEYFNLYQAEALTLAQLQFLMETFVQESLLITDPNSEHMSSDHILIVRLHQISPELIEFVRKYKYRKYFRFGLQGTFKAGLILVAQDAKSATFSKDLRDKKYHFVLEK